MTEEYTNVRCHTCGKVIGHYWHTYEKLLSQGKTVKEALDFIKLRRVCCRTRMMNPFKTITKSSRQTDPEDPTRSLESSFTRLSIATKDEAPATGALNSMQNVTGITIVPEEKIDIGLPDLPSLPPLPTPGSIKGTEPSKTTRVYRAL